MSSIHYELHLRGNSPIAKADRVLADLQAYARNLQFTNVSAVHALPYDGSPSNNPATQWLYFWAPMVATPFEDDEPSLTGDPYTARGFMVNPGGQYESAAFALLLRASDEGQHLEWYWRYSCKSQHTRAVSDANLVACHVALVALLDRAKALGMDVTVRDETRYWDTRDEAQLLAALRA
ncbi:MAG: hypothetical protein ABJE47_15565 [bacterium]